MESVKKTAEKRKLGGKIIIAIFVGLVYGIPLGLIFWPSHKVSFPRQHLAIAEIEPNNERLVTASVVKEVPEYNLATVMLRNQDGYLSIAEISPALQNTPEGTPVKAEYIHFKFSGTAGYDECYKLIVREILKDQGAP